MKTQKHAKYTVFYNICNFFLLSAKYYEYYYFTNIVIYYYITNNVNEKLKQLFTVFTV